MHDVLTVIGVVLFVFWVTGAIAVLVSSIEGGFEDRFIVWAIGWPILLPLKLIVLLIKEMYHILVHSWSK